MYDIQQNAYVELGVVRLRRIESVPDSEVDGDFEQIMLKDDEAAPDGSTLSL